MIWTATAVASQVVAPDDVRDHGPSLATLIRVYGVRDGVRRRFGRWRELPPHGATAVYLTGPTSPSR